MTFYSIHKISISHTLSNMFSFWDTVVKNQSTVVGLVLIFRFFALNAEGAYSGQSNILEITTTVQLRNRAGKFYVFYSNSFEKVF